MTILENNCMILRSVYPGGEVNRRCATSNDRESSRRQDALGRKGGTATPPFEYAQSIELLMARDGCDASTPRTRWAARVPVLRGVLRAATHSLIRDAIAGHGRAFALVVGASVGDVDVAKRRFVVRVSALHWSKASRLTRGFLAVDR
jgi:hypothetical protein